MKKSVIESYSITEITNAFNSKIDLLLSSLFNSLPFPFYKIIIILNFNSYHQMRCDRKPIVVDIVECDTEMVKGLWRPSNARQKKHRVFSLFQASSTML